MTASLILDSFRDFYEGLIKRFPSICVALVIFVFFFLLARITRAIIRRAFARLSTTAHVDVLVSRAISGLIITVGVIISLGVLGISMGALVASLGLVSVGLGFALKDILGNFIAGIIIILQKPYKIGDSVTLSDTEGVVEDIRIRDTILRRHDGRIVFIPNTNIFNSNITNNTVSGIRRSEFLVSIPLDDETDLDSTIHAISAALRGLEEILEKPPPQVVADEIKEGKVLVKVMFWSDPATTDLLHLKTKAISTVKKALYPESSSWELEG
jgi:small-conductance mechanosensitive channel